MRIAIGQINPIIGDIEYNAQKIIDMSIRAKQDKLDLIIFPELALSGYPPKDLLLRKDFVESISKVIVNKIIPATDGIGIIIGAPTPFGEGLANSCIIIENKKVLAQQNKTLLPNYDVFDESRYFTPTNSREVVNFRGIKLGLTVCEDIWNDKDYWNRQRYEIDPVKELVDQGADIIINISASPYHIGKQALREDMLVKISRKYNKNIVYVNQVGGNDDLVFDGTSFFVDSTNGVVVRGKSFTEDYFIIDTESKYAPLEAPADDIKNVHDALVLGLKDYLNKTGFNKAILGLSGGIDSALTAAIAVTALGKENVIGVSMPSQYSSEGSITDAKELADNLGIAFEIVPIRDIFDSYIQKLNSTPELHQDLAEENIQARIRGNILMFKSNREGALLLSTGNKSETAVGYTTLYGDMCGGLAVISDIPKTVVYKLAEYINCKDIIIPENTLTKPPSAELRPNQVDQDSLPEYEILDSILKAYIEDNKSALEIINMGYEENLVRKILFQVDRNEYKRRQAPPGLRVTTKAFGVGRRMPIAQGWRN